MKTRIINITAKDLWPMDVLCDQVGHKQFVVKSVHITERSVGVEFYGHSPCEYRPWMPLLAIDRERA